MTPRPRRLRLSEHKPLDATQRAIAAEQLTANEVESLRWMEAALTAPPPKNWAKIAAENPEEIRALMLNRRRPPIPVFLSEGRDYFKNEAERAAFAELTSDDGCGDFEHPEGAGLLRREQDKAWRLMLESRTDKDIESLTFLSRDQLAPVRALFEQYKATGSWADETGICGF